LGGDDNYSGYFSDCLGQDFGGYDSFDKDHWADPNHIRSLAEVIQKCSSKGYGIAVSNPCFELWILLHFYNGNVAAGVSCKDVEDRLRQVMGGYNKAKCCRTFSFTRAAVEQAIATAKSMDRGAPIQDDPMTQVYLIIGDLLEKGFITIP
jgi:RloB-like protein